MNISFPQNLFNNPPKNNIILGKQIAKKSKIVFCGIARNVEKTLDLNINRCKFVGSYFNDYKFFIYENNSVDSTQNILQRSEINYLSDNRSDHEYKQDILSGKDENHYLRCKVLSDCRNKYLSYASENYSDYDFLCVIDWDIRGFSYKGFWDSIYRLYENNNLGSVSSYGVLSEFTNNQTLEQTKNNWFMYDSFAFRPLNFVGPFYPHIQLSYNYFTTNEPCLVRSNFGGLCIYKMKNILPFKYGTNLNDNFVDCDHVVINDQISNSGYKHMLNPFLAVSYSNHRFINA